MNETQDRAKAYSFGLQASQASACLRIGWHKLKVSVTEYSWSGYTVVVQKRAARKLREGREWTLEYQGSDYRVNCLGSRPLSDGKVEVHLQLDQSATTPSSTSKKKPWTAATSVRLNHRDPLLGLASGIGLVVMLLILPGWGDEWGTSACLTNGFRTAFDNAFDACMCIFGK